jgi:hypothetical protein
LKKYQKAGEIKNEDASYINFVRSLPSNLQQPNDPSYNLKGYWNALGKPESFDYNQPTDLQGYYHAFSRDPYTGQILKAPFHPSFKEGVSDKGAYRIAGPKGDIYTQGFKYPAYEGPYALPKNVIIDNSYDFLDIPNYEGYFQIGGSLPKYQDNGEQSTEENPKVLPLTNVSSKKADWIVDKEKHGIDEIKWYESWNPKKWGLNDYSEYSSFNSAFRNARENKEEEFVYKGKRYNTQLIPKEDSDLYWESKNFLKDRNVDPYLKSKYGNTWQELYEMQKQVPTGNPEWEEINKKMDDIWDEQETIREKKNKDYDAYYKKNVIGKQSGERIASLDKPTYFSITNQKPKDMSEDGYWNPKENKMFMLANTEPGKLNTTYIHELSHKGDDIIDVMNTVPPINLEAFNAAPYKENFTQESFNYVSDPSETEARKLSTLFYLKKNKQPWKAGKITEETLNKLYEDHYDKKLPYDISQLLMLYGAQRDDLLKYLNGDFEYNYKPKEKKKGGESNVFNWSNLDQWFKNGGESDFANNIYDDYMTGIYDGTPLEGYAKKVYDKLNTMYYTQAKQAGMTPPNYIMTNVIKKSTAPS